MFNQNIFGGLNKIVTLNSIPISTEKLYKHNKKHPEKISRVDRPKPPKCTMIESLQDETEMEAATGNNRQW